MISFKFYTKAKVVNQDWQAAFILVYTSSIDNPV